MTEHDAGAELLWGTRQRAARGPKPKLSLEEIVRTAIGIADAEGLAALSMQHLAHEVGSGTMSLYRYIPGKDELISLMLDTAIGEPAAGIDEAGNWRAALEFWAHEQLAIFRRHPWILPLVTAPRMMGPKETTHLEFALRAVSGTGLSSAAMLDAVLLVNSYVRGVAQHIVNAEAEGRVEPHRPGFGLDLAEQFDQQDRYPTLAAVMSEVTPQAGRGFDFGLQRVLDGIEKFIETHR